LNRRFTDWRVHISNRLTDEEFGAGETLTQLESRGHVRYEPQLHLSVSMRSFRAEHVSQLVKHVLEPKFKGSNWIGRASPGMPTCDSRVPAGAITTFAGAVGKG